MTEQDQRRLAKFTLPERSLLTLFSGRCRIASPKLPADAEIARVYHDFMTNGWTVMVHSFDFHPVPDGGLVPEIGELTLEHFPDTRETTSYTDTDRKSRNFFL